MYYYPPRSLKCEDLHPEQGYFGTLDDAKQAAEAHYARNNRTQVPRSPAIPHRDVRVAGDPDPGD